MTDCFLAKVISYNSVTKKASVNPLVILKDGTEYSNEPIDVKTIQGIYPSPGDTVLIITSRNNLDDESISEYFEASWANGRLVGIVAANGAYTLKGNYVFKSDVTFESDVTIEGNLNVSGNASVSGDTDITGSLDVSGDCTFDSSVTVNGTSTFNGESTFNAVAKFPQDAKFGILEISFLLHKHISAAPGAPTGVPIP